MEINLLEKYLQYNKTVIVCREGEVFTADSFSFQWGEADQENVIVKDGQSFERKLRRAVRKISEMLSKQSKKSPRKRANYYSNNKRKKNKSSRL